jgi:SAM-dependent methyltransferase
VVGSEARFGVPETRLKRGRRNMVDPEMASEAERIPGLYQRHAFEWDRERGRDLIEKPWLDRFLSLLPQNASVLDIGCGAAEPIAGYLIERGCQVTGIDSSSALIGMCKDRFPDHEWLIADMRMLSLDRRFDGILAWNSFFHLSPNDQRPMFPLFRKHARSQAALMFTSGPSHGEGIGSYKGEPLYHGSLDGAEYRFLLHENGFELISNVVNDPDCRHHTVWLSHMRSICLPLNEVQGKSPIRNESSE